MDYARPAYRPPSAPRRQRLPERIYWVRRVLVALIALTVTYTLYLGGTLAMALRNPTYGVTLLARGAEWGRQHGIGPVVTWIETEYYRLNPAKVGGKPPAKSFGSGATAVAVPTAGYLPAPPRVITPAAHPLPGEGVWHVAGRTDNGVPAIYEAFIRPDAIHTSYVVGIAWMDPLLLRAQLYSGSFIPGGSTHFIYSAPITPLASRTLVAAFNAGFRMQDANGGYYTQGTTIIPLRRGAASVVVYKNGLMTVGAWGTKGFTMTNQVASVRQNLNLLVVHGHPVSDLSNPALWGATLGGTFNVWRSGLGVTKDGAIVYVGGPAMSISDLANVLVRAGAVTGMQLDINTDWVQYSTFTGAPGAIINGNNGTSLLSGMVGSPSRYFASWWNRDFYTMSLRPLPAGATSATSSTASSSTSSSTTTSTTPGG